MDIQIFKQSFAMCIQRGISAFFGVGNAKQEFIVTPMFNRQTTGIGFGAAYSSQQPELLFFLLTRGKLLSIKG
jgi:hypothetical protein